ncbi:MAG: fumarate hydratase [Candidatus Omnitrophota bacterium]
MRKINVKKIRKAVADLCIKANTCLRPDIEKAIRRARRKETSKRAGHVLETLLLNARIAKRKKVAICQDTGLAVVYLSIGERARLYGGSLVKAVTDGVSDGYRKGHFRRSVVPDPVVRQKRHSAAHAVIYIDHVKGSRVGITVSPKGFGSENKSGIKMLNPTEGAEGVRKFVVNTVKEAGPNACPPYIIGVGIGGTFEGAALLAKKALCRNIGTKNRKAHLRRLEAGILEEINRLNIGPAGLGGKTTGLAVNILEAPTHIAGLPVAVNVSCHATRSATVSV